MRVLLKNKKIELPEDPAHRYFLQLWFSMVHRHSLDSHRVQCMMSINILRELGNILGKSLQGIDSDIILCSEEVLDIISIDDIFKDTFSILYSDITKKIESLLSLLKEDSNNKKQKNKQKNNEENNLKKILILLINDVIFKKRLYVEAIIKELQFELFQNKDLSKIRFYTGSLLSYLIDDGYTIESLFSICKNFLASRYCIDRYGFQKNTNFVFNIFKKEDRDFLIFFRINGIVKNEYLPQEVNDVSFIYGKDIDLEDYSTSVEVDALLRKHRNNIFASIQVCAKDDWSAGIKAQERLLTIIDLLRFELERDSIYNDREFLSVKKEKMDARTYILPYAIPNPLKNISIHDFKIFINNFIKAISSSGLDNESKEKIKSAFRFYRMGKDSIPYPTKLLNWWTAIEYLSRYDSNKGIIIDIEKTITSILSLFYVNKHLESLKNTLSFLNIDPSKIASKNFNIINFNNISLIHFYEYLSDGYDHDHLCDKLIEFPVVKLHYEYIFENLSSPAKCHDFIDRHEKRLKWHIHRIWRIRCDITHSASYPLDLTLLCANLEYYIKFSLYVILRNIGSGDQIKSLFELYDTFFNLKDNLMLSLKENNSCYLEHIISLNT